MNNKKKIISKHHLKILNENDNNQTTKYNCRNHLMNKTTIKKADNDETIYISATELNGGGV